MNLSDNHLNFSVLVVSGVPSSLAFPDDEKKREMYLAYVRRLGIDLENEKPVSEICEERI